MQSSYEYTKIDKQVKKLLIVLNDEMKGSEIQNALGLIDRVNFRNNYLIPALESGLVEMTEMGKPNNPKQKYRLTEKGLSLKESLNSDEEMGQ